MLSPIHRTLNRFLRCFSVSGHFRTSMYLVCCHKQGWFSGWAEVSFLCCRGGGFPFTHTDQDFDIAVGPPVEFLVGFGNLVDGKCDG